MNKGSIIFPLMIVVASSSYGILSTIVKLSMEQGYTAAEAVTSQYVFGFVLAFILAIFTQRKAPTLDRKGILTILFIGLFTSITGIVYGQALIYLPASLAVVMLFQFTWIGILIDCLIKRRLPVKSEVISLSILFVGTILAAGVIDTDLSSIPMKGWVLGLLSALSFALCIQFNSRPVKGVTNVMRTLLVSIVAVVVVSIVHSPEIIWNGQITGGLWKYGLALGLFGIILPIILFSIAGQKVGGALASILSAMELPVAIIVSVLVLNEPLTTLQIAGIVLILLGMTVPTYMANRKTS